MSGKHLSVAVLTAVMIIIAVSASYAAGHYALAFWREVPCYENGGSGGGNHSMYFHVWDEDGFPVSGVEIRTTWGVLLGTTDSNGYCETVMAVANAYDAQCVDDNSSTSDIAYTMTTRRSPNWGHYSYEVGFMYKTNPSNAGTFDASLTGTVNQVYDTETDSPSTKSLAYYNANPTDWYSDDGTGLGTSSNYFGQTFVANGNRVVAVKAQCTIGSLQHMIWTAEIRDGGPTGTIVGYAKSSREMVSDEYEPIIITWGIDDIVVTPGNTYFLKIYNSDGSPMSSYRGPNNYGSGSYYENANANASYDLKGLVVCANAGPPPSTLQNPGFENGFGGNGVAGSWTNFVVAGSPQFLDGAATVHGGSHSQKWWTSYGTHDAGIYQQLSATVGNTYTFSTWTWRYDPWNNGQNNEITWVGIDPHGGTNPSSTNIIWSPGLSTWSSWSQQSVSAVAQQNIITLFIRGQAAFAGSAMVTIADDATLSSNATTGSIQGYVKDTNNNAISGATVSTSTGGYTTTSDANGNFLISGVTPGTYSLIATKTGFISVTNQDVVVTAGITTTSNFNLSLSPGTISGYVRNSGGTGISGATVSTKTGGYSTTTNASGNYTISSVTPGTYEITASKSGYQSSSNTGVTVSGGQTTTSNFTLQNAAAFAGVSNGNFEGGFYNDSDADHQSGNYWHRATISGSPKCGGHFGVWRSSHWSQSAWEANYTIAFYQVAANATVGTTYTASVWVQGGDSNVKFWVGMNPYGGTDPNSADVLWSAQSTPGGTWTQISKEAAARSSNITMFVKFQNPTGSNVNGYIDDASLTANGGGPTTGAITGTVKDTNNTAIAGATVSTTTGGYTTTTAVDGSYTLSNVTTGTYNVTASKSGYQSATNNGVTVAGGQTATSNFSLTPNNQPFSGILNGNYEGGFYSDPDADHQSGNNWNGVVMGGAPKYGGHYGEYHSTHWSESIWEANWLAAFYQKALNATTGSSYTASVWVKGTDTAVKFWVGIDPYGGSDPSSANVQWSTQSAPGATWTQISKQVTAQSSTITMFIKAQNTASSNYNAYIDDAALVDNGGGGGPTTGTLNGYVRDTSNNPISGATVSTSGGAYNTTTGIDGSYSISSVTPGTYSVTASKTSYQNQTQPNVTISAGLTTTVSFNLSQGATFSGLTNGNFEGGFYNDSDADHQSGNSWHRFSIAGASKCGGDYGNWHSTHWGQGIWESSWTAGFYQQATNATVGTSYTGSVWVKGTDSNVKFWVGVDPYGGTDANSTNIQWSAQSAPGGTWTQLTKSATAQSSTITLFIKAQNTVASNKTAWFDDAVMGP